MKMLTHSTVQRLWVILICGYFIAICTSCSTEHYKKDADKEVYNIIDKKWNSSLGPRSNYRINDVPRGPNDIKGAIALLPANRRLSLARALAIATAHNRQYQTEKEQLYTSALSLSMARYRFAPKFLGIFGGSYNRNAADESVSANTKLGVNQLLASGAQISANIANNWLEFLTGNPRTSLGSVLTASITQPLLRGSGQKIVQENLTQAERNIIYDLRSFSRYRKSFVVSIVSEYYRVLQAYDRVKNAKNNYDRLRISQKRTEMMAEAGRLPVFQVGQARQQTLQARDSYISAQQSYEQQLDSFKMQLALPTEIKMELDPNELNALESKGLSKINFILDDAVKTALACRLDLANQKDAVDDAKRKVMVAADNLGAELNITAGANVNSLPRTRMTRLQFQNGSYNFGFEGQLPLDRKAERNAYRQALINLMRQKRTYQQARDQVKFDVRQSYRELQEAAISYDIQVKSLELAKGRVESFKLLLQEGQASTRDLLDAQADLLSSQNAKTSALIRHTLAKLNFYRDIGLLQVRPDGYWQTPNLSQTKKISPPNINTANAKPKIVARNTPDTHKPVDNNE